MNAPHEREQTLAALKSGCVRTCARLISAIEREEDGLVPLLQALYCAGGGAKTIGVTGPPGAGKSSLVNQMVAELRRRGQTVAVLAVDPSSPFTGGAVLGDRLRMMQHSCDPGVFIRSMAARGEIGGLARAAGDALTVLDAMAWDYIIVETVGVGQNETDVMNLADIVALVQTPMGGDDVQAAKAGINEIGDIYIVNKADLGDVGRAVQYLQDMIALGHRLRPGAAWIPPVLKTQSLSGAGVGEAVDQICKRFAALAAHPDERRARARRRIERRAAQIMRDMAEHRLRASARADAYGMIEAILRRERDPYFLAAEMLADARGRLSA